MRERLAGAVEMVHDVYDALVIGWGPTAGAAAAGFALLDGVEPATIAFTLAFAGGAILAMLSTSMMPEAYEHAGRAVGIVTTFGFLVAFGIHWAQG